MKDEKKVLNLDELFGAQQPIAVMWAGQKHYLRRIEEMGPRDLVQYDRINALLNEVRGAAAADDRGIEAQAQTWEQTIDQMLRLVGPTLLEVTPPVPFVAKAKVLEFYTAQIMPEHDGADGADGEKPEKKGVSTGALSSAD